MAMRRYSASPSSSVMSARASASSSDARELIYGTVLELAMVDVVSGRESELLQWLGQTWQVEASFDSPEQ